MTPDNISADNGWTSLKHRLLQSGAVHPVFANTSATVTVETEKFEPLLLSRHIDRIGELVEKCLAIRREIRELEILAVKAAVDYDLFLKTVDIDQQAETLRLFIPAKTAEKTGQDAAESAFGQKDNLAAGFSHVADARSRRLASEIADSTSLAALIVARCNNVKSYQAAYHARYSEPGNAHNYGERAANLLRILQNELQEALERAVALNEGLQTIYQWSPGPLSTTFDALMLDDFVVWTLEAQRGLALRAELETTFDLVVPLVQPWETAQAGLVAKATFDAAIAGGVDSPITLKFTLDQAIFFGQKVRLKAVGIAFGNTFGLVVASGIDSVQTGDSFARISGTITSPTQTYSGGQKYNRPKIPMGNICLHQSAQPAAFFDGFAIENIDPSGDWEITLQPRIVWKDSAIQSLSKGVLERPIRDLKLTFRAYQPANL
jgi:hypothetical protein